MFGAVVRSGARKGFRVGGVAGVGAGAYHMSQQEEKVIEQLPIIYSKAYLAVAPHLRIQDTTRLRHLQDVTESAQKYSAVTTALQRVRLGAEAEAATQQAERVSKSSSSVPKGETREEEDAVQQLMTYLGTDALRREEDSEDGKSTAYGSLADSSERLTRVAAITGDKKIFFHMRADDVKNFAQVLHHIPLGPGVSVLHHIPLGPGDVRVQVSSTRRERDENEIDEADVVCQYQKLAADCTVQYTALVGQSQNLRSMSVGALVDAENEKNEESKKGKENGKGYYTLLKENSEIVRGAEHQVTEAYTKIDETTLPYRESGKEFVKKASAFVAHQAGLTVKEEQESKLCSRCGKMHVGGGPDCPRGAWANWASSVGGSLSAQWEKVKAPAVVYGPERPPVVAVVPAKKEEPPVVEIKEHILTPQDCLILQNCLRHVWLQAYQNNDTILKSGCVNDWHIKAHDEAAPITALAKERSLPWEVRKIIGQIDKANSTHYGKLRADLAAAAKRAQEYARECDDLRKYNGRLPTRLQKFVVQPFVQRCMPDKIRDSRAGALVKRGYDATPDWVGAAMLASGTLLTVVLLGQDGYGTLPYRFNDPERNAAALAACAHGLAKTTDFSKECATKGLALTKRAGAKTAQVLAPPKVVQDVLSSGYNKTCGIVDVSNRFVNDKVFSPCYNATASGAQKTYSGSKWLCLATYDRLPPMPNAIKKRVPSSKGSDSDSSDSGWFLLGDRKGSSSAGSTTASESTGATKSRGWW